VDCEPADTIKIINTDVNVDFDTPLDYVEPKPKKLETNSLENTKIDSNNNQLINDFRKTNSNTFIPFSGTGRRLGSE